MKTIVIGDHMQRSKQLSKQLTKQLSKLPNQLPFADKFSIDRLPFDKLPLNKLPLLGKQALGKPFGKKRQNGFFNGRVAAITGAGSGIGRELAKKLASLGCNLALSDISLERLAETKAMIAAEQGTAIHITTTEVDVADKAAVIAWAKQVNSEHGKVNFIFNNAGVAMTATVEGASFEDLEWITNINYWGVVYGTKAFLPYIMETCKATGEKGHIINLSSLFGIIALPSQSAYNASKFAVRGFTESLRHELDVLKCGVSATSIHPGGIRTNINKDALVDDSILKLGMPVGEKATKMTEKLLRFPADKAASIILEAVENNEYRQLIGLDAKYLDIVQRMFPSHYNVVNVKALKLIKALRRSENTN